MKKWKIILSVVLALLIIPVAAGAIYVNFVLDKVTVSDEEFDKDFDLNINTSLKNSESPCHYFLEPCPLKKPTKH